MNASNCIKCNILRIFKENLEQTIHFYQNICGMDYRTEDVAKSAKHPYCSTDGKLHIFSFSKAQDLSHSTAVCFIIDDNFLPASAQNPGYWKMGIALQNVDAAVALFHRHNYPVKPAAQFVDVGFLTSLEDPNGYCIELLQHDFEENFQELAGERGTLEQVVTSPPVIGQITIRCTDARKTCEFYTDVLGMQLVCTEHPGNSYPFTLYFFAYTEDVPPNAEDLSALENREWLYKRSYCQVEIQHRHTLPEGFQYCTNEGAAGEKLGHVGFCLEVNEIRFEITRKRLKNLAKNTTVMGCRGTRVLFVNDPDGYLIEIREV